jgi:hypothetical protein
MSVKVFLFTRTSNLNFNIEPVFNVSIMRQQQAQQASGSEVGIGRENCTCYPHKEHGRTAMEPPLTGQASTTEASLVQEC